MAFTKPTRLPRCEHCGNIWLPDSFIAALTLNLKPKELPRYCSRCKTPNWNKPPQGRRGRPVAREQRKER